MTPQTPATGEGWTAGQPLPSYMSPGATLWREIDALGGGSSGHSDFMRGWDAGHAEALTKVLAVLERRGIVDDGLAIENAAPGTGEKLLTIAREFIDKHHVSCAEATVNNSVYEEAPLLVEQLAEVAGYYTYPEDDA